MLLRDSPMTRLVTGSRASNIAANRAQGTYTKDLGRDECSVPGRGVRHEQRLLLARRESAIAGPIGCTPRMIQLTEPHWYEDSRRVVSSRLFHPRWKVSQKSGSDASVAR